MSLLVLLTGRVTDLGDVDGQTCRTLILILILYMPTRLVLWTLIWYKYTRICLSPLRGALVLESDMMD
jgi:hypothetical protein